MTPENYTDAVFCLTVLAFVLSVTALVAGYALGVARWKPVAKDARAHLFHAGQVNAELRERLRQAEAALEAEINEEINEEIDEESRDDEAGGAWGGGRN